MTNSTNTTIETSGGSSISGDAQAGRDLIGRDQYNYGATPAQFADMLTRLFGLMLEIPQARNVLLGARTVLEHTRRHLRRLAEYKEAHDLLQQLESSYLVVYSLIYDIEGPLLPAQVRWRSLDRSCADLQSSIQSVCRTITSASFAADVADWHDELMNASSEMQHAFGGRDLPLLDAVLADVNRVIGTQTPRMNDRLISIVDSLHLADLAQRLQQMHSDLVQAHSELAQNQATRLRAVGDDVAGLGQLAARLSHLRDLHDRWQQADNELRTEQATLSSARPRFPARWQRSLGPQLRKLCATALDEQEHELARQIDALDRCLGQPSATGLLDALEGCRRAVSRRLSQIDHDLHTLCKLLKEAGGPLDTLLEKLV